MLTITLTLVGLMAVVCFASYWTDCMRSHHRTPYRESPPPDCFGIDQATPIPPAVWWGLLGLLVMGGAWVLWQLIGGANG
jgi:hypothetical protein